MAGENSEDYVDLEAVASAIEGGGGVPESDDEPGTEPVPDQAESTESTAPEPTTETEVEEEFYPRADLESLLEGAPEEAREAISTAYKSFQRGFTQKSQGLSELSRAMDGVDPAQAREAFEFVNQLTSDREFAMNVHRELAQALELQGHSPAAADAIASREIESAVVGAQDDVDTEDPLAREVAELKARLDREQSERQRQSQVAEIERMDIKVRRDNPNYDDEDMQVVYKIAASRNGDLIAAAEEFEGIKDRLITNYVAAKTSGKKAAAPVQAAASHSETPVSVGNVDEAHKLAVERARQLFADREN